MTKRSPLLTASALAFALAGAAGAGAARADELVVPKATPAAAEPEAPAPQAPANWLVYNERPITLSKGMLLLHGDLVANLSSGHGGKPNHSHASHHRSSLPSRPGWAPARKRLASVFSLPSRGQSLHCQTSIRGE